MSLYNLELSSLSTSEGMTIPFLPMGQFHDDIMDHEQNGDIT